ncbi:hypothetical protein PT015_07840 [Candidatus Mycobacterium wuenschmannii]|uniref:Mce associated membrane protein n=1 Tax=Candidatus Mycobacterium wuenschmannii TaxID=3027808 RepID=A0ABY8W0R3_9MYCO|nr:hypothetical protein [Candidatus Mycobacterium wuenschmannii]WIM89342.1 hypothetical protein PT015_07840 [Candidatus Mycobacterium wuenschmannii]
MSDDSDPSDDDAARRGDLADADEAADDADLTDDDEALAEEPEGDKSSRGRLSRTPVLFILLPAVAVLLGAAVGYLTWRDYAAQEARASIDQSIRAASETTVAILSYKPETVDEDLKSAGDRLAEPFRQEYTQLVKDVVAPGAKEQHITAVATVPFAASISASRNHAAVLVFVDQTTTIGNDPPTQSTSSVRVTLEKVDGRWLISQFDPV